MIWFKIDIFDGKVKMTKEPLRYFQETHPGKFSVNTLTELEFEIDEEWRKTSNHEATKNVPKTFYAKVKTTICSNKDAYTGKKGQEDVDDDKWLSANPDSNPNLATNKFSSIAPNGEIIGVKFTKEDEAASYPPIDLYFLKIKGSRYIEAGKKHASNYTKKELAIYNTKEGTVLTNQKVSFGTT